MELNPSDDLAEDTDVVDINTCISDTGSAEGPPHTVLYDHTWGLAVFLQAGTETVCFLSLSLPKGLPLYPPKARQAGAVTSLLPPRARRAAVVPTLQVRTGRILCPRTETSWAGRFPLST